jgi:hypothetical protein
MSSQIEFNIPVPPEKLLFKLTKNKLTITKKITNEEFSTDSYSVIGLTINHTSENKPIYYNGLYLKNNFNFDDGFFMRHQVYKDDMSILIRDYPSVNQWEVCQEMKLENFNLSEYNHFFIATNNENVTSYFNISILDRFFYFHKNKKYIYEFDSYYGYILKEVEQIEDKTSLNSNPEYSIYFMFYGCNKLTVGDIRDLNRLLEKQVKNTKGMYSLRLVNFYNVIKNIVANIE